MFVDELYEEHGSDHVIDKLKADKTLDESVRMVWHRTIQSHKPHRAWRNIVLAEISHLTSLSFIEKPFNNLSSAKERPALRTIKIRVTSIRDLFFVMSLNPSFFIICNCLDFENKAGRPAFALHTDRAMGVSFRRPSRQGRDNEHLFCLPEVHVQGPGGVIEKSRFMGIAAL